MNVKITLLWFNNIMAYYKLLLFKVIRNYWHDIIYFVILVKSEYYVMENECNAENCTYHKNVVR